jgi:hypothetical protein
MNYMNIALSLVVGGGIGYFASTLKSPDISEHNQCYKSESKSIKSPVFMFDGKTYFMSDLPLPVQLDLLKKSQSTFEQSAKTIEQTVLRMLLAKEKGISLSDNRIPTFKEIFGDDWIPASKVKEFYELNRKTFPAASTFESMEMQIKNHLVESEIQTLTRSKLSEIKSSSKLVNLMPVPCGPKIEIDVDNQPTIPSKIKTNSTFVMLGDFSCSQCRQSYLSLMPYFEQISENTNIVHIAYSDNEAGLGFDLAKGSVCAAKQGPEKTQSWTKASYLASMKVVPGATDDKAILEEAISNSGLDRASFDTCFNANETAEFVKKNNAVAKFNNVTGEMAIFLNKRLVISSSADQIAQLTKISK